MGVMLGTRQTLNDEDEQQRRTTSTDQGNAWAPLKKWFSFKPGAALELNGVKPHQAFLKKLYK